MCNGLWDIIDSVGGVEVADAALWVGMPEGYVKARFSDIGLPALICDADGRIRALNSDAGEIFCPEAVPGARLSDLAAKEDDVEGLQRLWLSNASRGRGWSHECRLRGRHGADADVYLVVVPISDQSRDGVTWLVVVDNLTESLIHARELEIYASELGQLYQENRKHLVELQEAQRSREHFFSLVSHELKTPLTSLKAALEMLGSTEAPLPEETYLRRLINNMDRSTTRLERMINDLLDLATVRSGGLSLNLGIIDIVEVIDAVVEEMSLALDDKSVSLMGDWSQKRGLIVKGDEIRLQQIVQNLLSNAVKAAPENGVIHIGASRSSPNVRVSVSNPGVSLDPTVKGRLFDPFRKVSGGGYKAGAGLGLSVVDSLVRAHGGTVSVTDSRRRVSFTFVLPLWRKEGAS